MGTSGGDRWNDLRVPMLDATPNDCQESARAATPVQGGRVSLINLVREDVRDETQGFPEILPWTGQR